MILALLFAVAGMLPDPHLTPGATNSHVTQENIATTICGKGVAIQAMRPPLYTTLQLKRKMMKAYGIKGSMHDYELDHLISLELGGAPSDPANLWPEPYEPRPNAHEKDIVENFLHHQVCSGAMTLAAAQQAIAKDWVAVYRSMPNKKRAKAAKAR